MITSRIAKYFTNSNAGIFCHPILSDTEHVQGSKLGIDFWSNTCYGGEHAFVEEFVEVKTGTATVLTSSLGSV